MQGQITSGTCSITQRAGVAAYEGGLETVLEMREAFKKLHQAQSMTAELTTKLTITGQPGVAGLGTIALKKPNLLNITLSSQAGARSQKQRSVYY